MNSLAVLTAATLAGADLALTAMALRRLQTVDRTRRARNAAGAGRHGAADRRKLQRQSGLDAGRAVACSARRRSGCTAGASRCWATCWNWARRGRALHAELAEPVDAQAIDLVFCAGPLMRHLFEALPPSRRGGYAETAAALEPQVLSAISRRRCRDDQGLAGSRMGPIAKALQQALSRTGRSRTNRSRKVDCRCFIG